MRRGDRLVSAVADYIVESPATVIAVFLVATVVFGVGAGGISTDSGTEQFTEDLDEFDAIESVNNEFSEPFAPNRGSTQLIQTGENVVSKKGLVRMLEAQEAMERNRDLRVDSVVSPASLVASEIEPDASTTEERAEALRRATEPQVRRTVRALADEERFTSLVSTDFNPSDPYASTALGTVVHDIDVDVGGGPEGGGDALLPVQRQAEYTVDTFGGDIRVFGSGIISDEFNRIIGDSLSIVIPASIALIVLFLIFAYRDPIDLFLALVALLMAVVWTLGFMGFAGIAFNENLVALPPILLAIGIDFSIHAVNRYREERVAGGDVDGSMRTAMSQLAVAFFIVVGTTAIGFGSNLLSSFAPTRNFGLVAAVSMVFVLLIFGVFFPAAKVLSDRIRADYGVPEFGSAPLGAQESLLGRLLPLSARFARPAPALVLVVFLVASVGAASYATGVDTEFSETDFLPPEEQPDYIEALPEPFAPSDYTVVRDINLLEREFESGADDEVLMLVEGHMSSPEALESIRRAGEDPPPSFVDDGREASYTSVLDAVDALADDDDDFAAFVRRNDASGTGVPDANLDELYDRLLASGQEPTVRSTLADDRRSALVTYDVEGEATNAEVTEDAWEVADRHRLDATPTGQIVLFQAVTDLILEDAVTSLVLALFLVAVFLVLLYGAIEGRPSLGIVNLVPVVVAVSFLGASMRAFGIPFNAITATILAITIGLGIDYTVHATHRFIDEYKRGADAYSALVTTLRGTGGALTGSMLTTSTGTFVLVLAIIPIIGQFGVLTALSVFYAYAASILVLPAALLVWARFVG